MTRPTGSALPSRSRRLWAAALVTCGVASNLASNFVGPVGPGPSGECAPASENVQLSGNLQTGITGAPLGGALRLSLVCQDSVTREPLRLAGRVVQWAVQGNEGLVNGAATASTPTGSDGSAQVHWSLGTAVGNQVVSAQVSGRTYSFGATALPPVAGGSCTAGGTLFDPERRVIGGETWTLAGSPYRGVQVNVLDGATLRIEAGVTVCVQSLQLQRGASLQAEGLVAQPIRFTVADKARDVWVMALLGEAGAPAALSVLRHVRADNLRQFTALDHAVQVEDSHWLIDPAVRAQDFCPQVSLRTTGAVAGLAPSALRRSVLEGYGGAATGCEAAVVLDAHAAPAAGPSVFEARVTAALRDGLRVQNVAGAPAWRLQGCELSGNGRHGAVFEGTAGTAGATVSGCLIAGNGGLGIENRGSTSDLIDARGNWWGDAAGPAGPAGDGVSAGVDTAAALAAPPVLGY